MDAVLAAIEDEFLNGHQGRRDGDLFAVVIEGSDEPGLKIEAEDFRIAALQGEEVVVFLFLLLGDVAQQDEGMPLVAGDGLRRGGNPAVRAGFR